MSFTLALFAPVLLSAFGPNYRAGVSSLVILSVAMLVATGIGPVDIVLLMGGRSSWNLFNVAVALILNLVLGLILVPRIGIAGAAVGLAGAILFNNVAPLVEVRAFLKVHPFGPAFFPVAASAALCFGGLGAAARLALGESVPVLGGYLVLGSAG
jgi:O-antigen/teichoic acid export membrane protein